MSSGLSAQLAVPSLAVSISRHLCQRLCVLRLCPSLCFLCSPLHHFLSGSFLSPSTTSRICHVLASPSLLSASLSVSLSSRLLFPLGPLGACVYVHLISRQGHLSLRLPLAFSLSFPGQEHACWPCGGRAPPGTFQPPSRRVTPPAALPVPIPALVALHPLPLMPSTPSPPSALNLHLPFSSSQVFGDKRKEKSHPYEEFYLRE